MSEYVADDGAPLKCTKCESVELKEIPKEFIEGCTGPCEYEVVCSKCNQKLGYWAYGYWEFDCD